MVAHFSVVHFTRVLRCLAFIGFLTLVACTAKPTLLAKSAAVPVGVDLSGRWLLSDGQKSARPTSGADDDGIEIQTGNGPRRARKPSKGSSSAARVFLEYGQSLKITQTDFGIFISYDRSIVEEFRFGENRLVTVGPIEAIRVSGWEGNRFVVETLDDNNSMLAETWQLKSDNQVLVRDIRISNDEQEIFRQRQTFDRQ
jgi:hypothetical protein